MRRDFTTRADGQSPMVPSRGRPIHARTMLRYTVQLEPCAHRDRTFWMQRDVRMYKHDFAV